MKIIDVVCSAGRTGFYFDDQRAIKGGAGHDGVFYVGAPVTEGFRSIRQAGESISVMIILEDGQVAYGDCAAVQYSGAGGRDPLFLAEDFIPVIEKYIKPTLVGKEAANFRQMAADMEAIEVEGKRLHTAIRYGVSQALLDAVADAVDTTNTDYKLVYKKFFPYISDLSYGAAPREDGIIEAFMENMPGYGTVYNLPMKEMQRLNLPVLDIGSFGKDAHKFTERIEKKYTFEVAPELVYKTVMNLLK